MKAVLAPAVLLALAACSEPSGTPVLSSRVAAALDPAAPCDRLASVDYLPDGTRIRIPVDALFVAGRADLTECGQYVLASVTQAMLDPRIMQVVVEPDADAVSSLSQRRVDMVTGRLTNVGFTRRQPPVLVQPATAPSPGAVGIVLAVNR